MAVVVEYPETRRLARRMATVMALGYLESVP
jgi:hypothetical protein